MKDKSYILASYACGEYFSGQRIAFEIVINGLKQRGWLVSEVQVPCLNRTKSFNHFSKIIEGLRLAISIPVTWFSILTQRDNCIHLIAMGQTFFSMIRDTFPILLRRHRKVVLLTNGSNFMSWDLNSLKSKFLRNLVHHAEFLSVVGPIQKEKLISLGIPQEKIVVVDNTCILAPLSKEKILNKQETETINPLNILYLSSLIETKGYIDFVKAIENIAKRDILKLDVHLCGEITLFDTPTSIFKRTDQAENWLNQKINNINSSTNVHITWHKGISGIEKQEVFRKAHIFVLPTQYPTEAQPLVLIEALANGCAIVTTDAGEIPTTLSSETAVFLNEVSDQSIAKEIIHLCNNKAHRTSLSEKAHFLFQERFSIQKHIDFWEDLLFSI